MKIWTIIQRTRSRRLQLTERQRRFIDQMADGLDGLGESPSNETLLEYLSTKQLAFVLVTAADAGVIRPIDIKSFGVKNLA